MLAHTFLLFAYLALVMILVLAFPASDYWASIRGAPDESFFEGTTKTKSAAGKYALWFASIVTAVLSVLAGVAAFA